MTDITDEDVDIEIDERLQGYAEEISEGDIVEADMDNGIIYNRTTGKQYKTAPFPEFVQKIIENGGLIQSIADGVIK